MKNKWLFLVMALALVLVSPAMAKRHLAEWNNRTYELIMPYDEIEALAEDQSEEDVWNTFKQAGLTTVSIEAETLDSLDKVGDVLLLKMDEFYHTLLLTNTSIDTPLPRRGLVVYIVRDTFPVVSALEKTFGETMTAVRVNGRTYYVIEGESKKIEHAPLGYSEAKIDAAIAAGFRVVLRIPDARDVLDTSAFVLNEINARKNEHISKLLPTGEQIAGYPTDLAKWGKRWEEAGYSLLSTEFHEAKGLQTVANAMNMRVVRLHSLNLEQRKPNEAIDVAVRAVKERNIRALFIRPFTSGEREENIEKTARVIAGIVAHMPAHYTLGESEPFPLIARSFLASLALVFGSAAFTFCAVQSFLSRRLALLASAGALGAGVIGTFLDVEWAWQLLALLIAVLTPVYAAIPSAVSARLSAVAAQYGRAIVISFVGISWIVVALYGTNYMAYVGHGFRGVKLVYVVPLLGVTLYALVLLVEQPVMALVKKLWRQTITLGHVVVTFIVLAVLAYYVLRSGNAGVASAWELTVRQKLEEWLFVRPRTKEFLLGFPLYTLALYMMSKRKQVGAALLVVGTIGWLSIINTFTHLHIPLFISFIRTMYSLVLGFTLGIVLIYAARFIMKWKKVI